MADKMKQFYHIFPYPESSTFVCGNCFTHRDYLHIIGGYNFADLMSRKYRLTAAQFDALSGQHLAIQFNGDDLSHTVEDLIYSRLIGASCSYDQQSETAYIFGGIHEEIGLNADPDALFVSNLMIIQRFRDGTKAPTTIVTPIAVSHPPGRVFHSSAWDPDRLSIWIFGGGTVAGEKHTSKNFFNDLWEYSTVTEQWVEHKAKHTPSGRWGQAMTYCDNKLFIFGGTAPQSKRKAVHLYILNLTDIENLVWVETTIPKEFKQLPNGCQMLTIEHQTIGKKILFTGGCDDPIYKNLGFSADLNVDQALKNLDVLQLWLLDPKDYSFSKIKLPQEIPNVSYHGAAIQGDYLYLAGGLNHTRTGRIFCKEIYQIRIFDLILFSQKADSKYLIPQSLPVETKNIEHPRHLTEHLAQFAESEIEKAKKNHNTLVLIKLFEKHQNSPFPCNKFSYVYAIPIANNVITSRLHNQNVDTNQLPSIYAKDFVYYLYTGIIVKDESKYLDFRSFMQFILFCWRIKLYRLMWFEFCQHSHNLSLYELLTLSAAIIRHCNGPLVEDPNFYVLKNLLCNSLMINGKLLLAEEIIAIPNIGSLSSYIIELIEAKPKYDLSKKLLFPESTVFYDLSVYLSNEMLNCADSYIGIDTNTSRFDKKIAKNCNSIVLTAVAQLNLKLVYQTKDSYDVALAINLFNSSSESIGDSLVQAFINHDDYCLKAIARKDNQFKFLLQEMLLNINHKSILYLILELIGINSIHRVMDRKNRVLQIDNSVVKVNFPFYCHQFNVSWKYLNAVVVLLYRNCTPLSLPVFFKRKQLTLTLLNVCGECPQLFNMIKECRKFILQNLVWNNKSNTFSPDFIVKHFIHFLNLDMLDKIFSLVDFSQLLPYLAYDIDKNPNKRTLQWILKSCNTKLFNKNIGVEEDRKENKEEKIKEKLKKDKKEKAQPKESIKRNITPKKMSNKSKT